MTQTEALKLADALNELLESFENGGKFCKSSSIRNELYDRLKQTLEKSKEALAQPEQEPVAWQPLPCPFCGHIGLDFADGETYRWGVASCGGCGASCGDVRREYPDKGEWHTEAIAEWNKRSPTAQRTWVNLPDEEIKILWIQYRAAFPRYLCFAKTLLARAKEKNT